MVNTETLKAAHKKTFKNKANVLASEKSGCIYCCNIFPSSEILTWADKGETAVCPKCGCDSVLPSNAGFLLTDEFLGDMYTHYFESMADTNVEKVYVFINSSFEEGNQKHLGYPMVIQTDILNDNTFSDRDIVEKAIQNIGSKASHVVLYNIHEATYREVMKAKEGYITFIE